MTQAAVNNAIVLHRLSVSRIHNRNTTAMIIHVTTTDSYTGIPPNKGIVNTVSQLSSSISPSSKLKKSKKMLSDTEPYFFTLQSEMSRI